MLRPMDDLQPLHIAVDGTHAHGLRLAGAPEVGRPIVLIHGLACSSEVYRPLLADMAVRTFRRAAIALDMPGYGRTPGPVHALDIEALARWNLAAMTTLDIRHAHLVGHSMGCQVALAMARLAPDRITSATLIGPTSGAEGQRRIRYALGLVADSLFESLAYNLTLLTMWRQMGARRYLHTVPAMLRDRPLSLGARVRCPVLLIRGARDCIVPERAIRQLAAALPDTRRLTVPKVAHAVQFDRPDEFLAALLPFLIDVESAAATEISA